MGSRFRPGIPDTFTFDVAPVNDLGDYLDEQRPTPKIAKQGREAPVAARPLHAPQVRAPIQEHRPVSVAAERATVLNANPPVPAFTPVVPQALPEPVKREPKSREARGRVMRREINMTADALRMSDELLEMIRNGSGQRDTMPNEMFHALVLLVHEVKDELDLHAIPKRGQWGSPTARAYPIELKNAFLKAVRKRYEER